MWDGLLVGREKPRATGNSRRNPGPPRHAGWRVGYIFGIERDPQASIHDAGGNDTHPDRRGALAVGGSLARDRDGHDARKKRMRVVAEAGLGTGSEIVPATVDANPALRLARTSGYQDQPSVCAGAEEGPFGT